MSYKLLKIGRCACDEVVRLAEAEGRAAKRPQGPARTRRAKRVPSFAARTCGHVSPHTMKKLFSKVVYVVSN